MIAFIDMHRLKFGAWAICRILRATECGFITDVFSRGIVGWAVAPPSTRSSCHCSHWNTRSSPPA